MSKKILLLLFFLFTALHFFVSYIIPNFIPYLGFFPYKEIAEESGLPQFIQAFANFDGVHYISIATKGYMTYEQAFFPVFPLTIYFLNIFIKNPLLTGLIISSVSACIGILIFHAYAEQITKKSPVNMWILLFLLAFPTSFFFNALYTEGLFFLLLISALYFFNKKDYLSAAICGYILGLTRIIGIFVVIPYFIQIVGAIYFHKANSISGFSFKTLKDSFIEFFRKVFSDYKLILLFCAPFFGLCTYCIYLWQTTGDPLFFFNSQPAFGANRSTSLILVPQVEYRYLKIFLAPFIVEGGQFNFQYFMAITEFLFFNITAGLLLWDLWKIIKNNVQGDRMARLGLNLFSWAIIILPTLTGTFSSIPRYVLLCLAIFFTLAEIRSNSVKLFISCIFVCVHLLLFGLFIQGYFVS